MNTASAPASMAFRAGAGFGWNLAGGLVRALSSLAINTLLARRLGPEPFGQVALAMVVIGLGGLLVDAGLTVGLIQKAELEELDIRSAFTTQLAVGLALAAGLATLAPWGAALLAQESVTPVLRVLSALLLIQACGQTGTALLRRAGDFRRVQQLQIGSYLAAYLGVGLPLALQGAGVWSLVAAQLAQATLYSAAVWLATRHSLRLWVGRRSMAGFGLTIVSSNLLAWAVSALPSLLIGRFQGVLLLGYFTRAFFLVNMPASVLAASLQTTSLTVYSRLQRHPRLTARTCLGLSALCLLLTVLPFAAAAAMPRTIIEALFGPAWLPMAGLFTPLALAMPLECIAALSGPLLIARGKPDLELRVQAATATSTLLVVGALSIWSTIAAVTWGVFVAVYGARGALAVAAMLRETEIPAERWLRGAAAPAVLGLVCFAVVRILEQFLIEQGLAPWFRLAMLGSMPVAVVGLRIVLGQPRTTGRSWAAKVMAAYV
jgi:O-antigen/teichoic acid export membrane protein